MESIRQLIKETISHEFLCEVKIDITDEKKRGFADTLGKLYKSTLSILKPKRIYGKLGLKSEITGEDFSVFEVNLQNGDKIQALRNTSPAFGNIIVNGKEFFVNSHELLSNKFPELIKKYYLEYKTANAGIPSI